MRRIAASFIVLVLSGSLSTLLGQVPAPIHGVTVEDTHDVTTEPFQTQVVTALRNLRVGPDDPNRLYPTPSGRRLPGRDGKNQHSQLHHGPACRFFFDEEHLREQLSDSH